MIFTNISIRMIAKVSAPMLSSQMVVLTFVRCSSDIPMPFFTAHRSSRSGITDFIAVPNALYSASNVEVAMSGLSLLVHITSQLAMQMAKPVRRFTHDGSCLSSYGQRPAKSASTKQSTSNSLYVGFNTSPSSCVCLSYCPTRSNATS